MFAAAVDERVLAVSLCHRVRLPRDDRPEVIPPTVEQIVTLAAGVPVRYRALVVLLDGSGPRIGQALAGRRRRDGGAPRGFPQRQRTVHATESAAVAFRPRADSLRTDTACPA